ncbi:MAG: hypothetical protein JEZ07_06420 [Phycisphaerae bacterium]|nr:hypothetical protein [Phycisphaerae bacterium]
MNNIENTRAVRVDTADTAAVPIVNEPEPVKCPHCGSDDIIVTGTRGFVRGDGPRRVVLRNRKCRQCGLTFASRPFDCQIKSL